MLPGLGILYLMSSPNGWDLLLKRLAMESKVYKIWYQSAGQCVWNPGWLPEWSILSWSWCQPVGQWARGFLGLVLAILG